MIDNGWPNWYEWKQDEDEVYEFILSFKYDTEEFEQFMDAVKTFNPYKTKLRMNATREEYMKEFWKHYRRSSK